ncbi:MAG: hypothetical protein ACOYJB_07040 [Christensenellaceae bacterium]|jgi:flagellar basal body L-ring protein FlgH
MKKKFGLVPIVLFVVAVFAFSACAPAQTEASPSAPAQSTPAPTEAATPEQSASPSPDQSASAAPSDDPAGNLSADAVSVTVTGEITDITMTDDDEGQIHVVGDAIDGTITDVVAIITDDTEAIDAQTGLEADLRALNVGDTVTIYVSAAMTRSQPPQAQALAVITNLPAGGLGIPKYIVVQELTKNDDGSIAVLNQNKDVIVTIPADLAITEMDGEAESINEIEIGDDLFAWYDAVALSYPAQATAERVVLA